VEDEELIRARRALQGVDPELDLARVYAESRARAHGGDEHRNEHGDEPGQEHEQWAPDGRVEIVLRGAGQEHGPTRLASRRARVLVWGAAAAAAAALVVGVVNVPEPRTVPGGSPSTATSAPTTPDARPLPSATFGSTPSEVVLEAAEAVAATSCGVKTHSALGEESTSRFDGTGATDTGTPKPLPLGPRPLQVLEAVAVDTVLGLTDLGGADHRLHDDLTLERVDGRTMVRIGFAPPAGRLVDGKVTAVDVLVDTDTWLPHSAQVRAESDGGEDYLVLSRFSWAPCDSPGDSPTPR
jgi:hypothetical protein